MKINIIEDDLIVNIQRDFQYYYPYLKLRFYKNPHEKGEGSRENECLDIYTPIEEVTMFHTSCSINISPDYTVADLEDDFFRNLGLCVQVFRQSGNIWLETTSTDDWTLQQQNEKGKESLNSLPREHPREFDLQDVN